MMKDTLTIVRPFIVTLALIAASITGKGQTTADTVRSEMTIINSKYDSAFFMTLDIRINYNSDTVFAGTDSADYSNTEMTGVYTFHGNKALYRLGDIEYMQNDSFTIAVYNNEKFILVGKTIPGIRASNFVPVKATIDSMLVSLEQYYESAIMDYDSVKRISFKAIDSTLPYQRIDIEYDPGTYLLTKVKYKLRDAGQVSQTGTANDLQTIRKAEMVFLFQNYRVLQVGEAVFSEARYLFFDGPAEIRPADAYKDYTIYKNF